MTNDNDVEETTAQKNNQGRKQCDEKRRCVSRESLSTDRTRLRQLFKPTRNDLIARKAFFIKIIIYFRFSSTLSSLINIKQIRCCFQDH